MIKRVCMFLAGIVLVPLAGVIGQQVGSVVLDYSSYSYFLPYEAGGMKAGSPMPIVAGRASAGGSVFGLFSSFGKNALAVPVIEIREASTQRLIRRVLAAEFFGESNADWKLLNDRSVHTSGKASDLFAFISSGVHYTFGRTFEVVTENGAPFSKQIRLTLTLGSEKETAVSVSLLGAAGGMVWRDGSHCWIGDASKESDVKACVVMNLVSDGSLLVGAPPKKGDLQSVVFKSGAMHLSGGSQNEVLAITITGTTVGAQGHALQQVRNYLAMKKEEKVSPQIVAVTSVDRPATVAGDTVTYTISYCNVGTAPAADLVIDNPVPPGTHYLDHGNDPNSNNIVLHRSDDSVSSLSWKFGMPIVPGERQVVTFRVKVL